MTDSQPPPTPAAGPVPGGAAPVELSIDAARATRAILIGCLVAEIGFVVLDYHINYGRWTENGAVRRMFNIGREDSLASWFGTIQTTLVALTLWAIFAVVRRQPVERWRRAVWGVLAGFYTYMAVDDGVELHERMGTVFTILGRRGSQPGEGATLAGRLLDSFPSYAWQIVFLPLFAAFGVLVLYFLWRESCERSSRVLVVTAVCLFVAAVGLDFFEGLDPAHPWNPYAALARSWDLEPFTQARFEKEPFDTLVHFSKSIEECIEMMGHTFLWLVFLRRLREAAPDVRLRLAPERP